MAVAFDASMTAGNSADGLDQQAGGATTITSSAGLTLVAATGLLGTIVWENTSGTDITSRTMTWNSVSMTEQASGNLTSGGRAVRASVFSLPNPATGAQALSSSWTTAADCYMSGVGFTGTDTVTVVKTSDNTTANATTTITVPSDTSGATVACFIDADTNAPTVNFTKIFATAPLNPGGGGSYTLGGTSNAHTFTGTSGLAKALAGVHVLSGTGVVGTGVSGPYQLHGVGTGPIARKRFTQRYPDPTGFPPSPPDNTRVWLPFKEEKGPGRRGPPGRMAPQRYPDNFIRTISTTYIATWVWKGQQSPLSVIISEALGTWSWSGTHSPLSIEIVTTSGTWTWVGTSSNLGGSVTINETTGQWTWAGISAPLSTIVAETAGQWNWAGTTSQVPTLIIEGKGQWSWSGSQSQLSRIIAENKGQWTWLGKTSGISTGGSGSVIVFYDGLNVAGGLHYHKDLSRPVIILTPVGDGTYTVTKTTDIKDERPDLIKETVTIDGDIP